MLHPELPEILKYLLEYKDKIGYILLITNGTILPNDELLSAVSSGGDQIRVVIDSYPAKLSSDNAGVVKKMFREAGVNAIINPSLQWYDLGTSGSRYSTDVTDIRETFDSCPFRHCTGLYNGRLYRCARPWGIEINAGEAEDDNAVIDLGEVKSRTDMYFRLVRFFGVDYLKACAYCKKDCVNRPVEAGEQMT